MQSSAQGNSLTEMEEGKRLTLYRDIAGNWTIGYGHLVRPGEDFSAGLTDQQAIDLFLKDKANSDWLVNYELAPQIASGQVSQGEFDALSDAVFNMGDFLKASTLLKMLVNGNVAGAEQQLARWDNAGGKPNAALEARRILEMQLWSAGANG